MNYKIHIPFIILLLSLQFFMTNIFSYFFLPTVEKQLAKKQTGITYKNQEYDGISSESPKEYYVASVEKAGTTTTETYYLKNGTKVRVTYVEGRWQSTDTEPTNADLFLPLLGFALISLAVGLNVIRTGNIWTRPWQLTNFNKLEIILLIYGVPVFVSPIVFSWLGKGP